MLTGRVLLAEDNVINQDVARAMLERLGCAVEIVGDGRQAVARAFEVGIDVVLMDCQMPELDGYAAAQAIRRREGLERRPTRLPIVALTAHALQGDREKCLEAGMDDYLTKPLMAAELRRVLGRWLRAADALRAPGTVVSGGVARPAPAGLEAASAAVQAPPVVAAEGVGPVLDRAAVLARCMGDAGLLETLLQVFVKQSAEDVAEIRGAQGQGDAPRLLRAVHRLKGAAANLELERVRQAAFALEMHVRAQGLPDAGGLLARLGDEVDALAAAVAAG